MNQYENAVRNVLINILMDEQKISEKDFTKVDAITDKVDNFISSSEAKSKISSCKKKNCRPDLCAEILYHNSLRKQASTKKTIQFYKSDWLAIGRKAGWMRTGGEGSEGMY